MKIENKQYEMPKLAVNVPKHLASKPKPNKE